MNPSTRVRNRFSPRRSLQNSWSNDAVQPCTAHLLHLGIVIDRGTCTELYAQALSGYYHDKPLWDQSSCIDNFTFRTRCPSRGGGSHPRGRSARCLWFPIRIPGSAGPSPSRKKKGMSGIKRKTKKNGRPRLHKMTVIARDPIKRMMLQVPGLHSKHAQETEPMGPTVSAIPCQTRI